MQRLRNILLLLTAASTAIPAPAQNYTPPPLGVVVQKEDLHFAEDFYRALVTVGTNKFAFFLPEGFRLNNNPADGSIKLINREGNCKITFSILGPVPETGELNPETYRALLLEQHPDAKILTEFSRGVAGQGGPAFDLEWKGPSSITQSARVLFVASPMGVLEFMAVSTPNNQALMQNSFGRVTGSFWISRDGKFEVLHPFTGS